ncbi:uncharacterized protein LOC141705758 [Apium graveolens]|uniref:uncharacterized protein LOC141705758 n=1 Tax=Apium graveolens TaxID=4045 RepID=UPI003D79651C
MLDEINQLVDEFRQHRDLYESEEVVDLEITLKVIRSESGRDCHISNTDEVAGIMVGDTKDTCGESDIVVHDKIKGLVRVSYVHPKLMALQYPLLFSRGEDGLHPKIKFQKNDESKGLTPTLGGRLFQQYSVDAFSSIEQTRLWWFRTHQTTLRNELYSNICDSLSRGDVDTSNIGKGIILPAGFVGSKRLKLDQLLADIKTKKYFGVCNGVMYVVEFQKRGLPHVHMLIWLDADLKKNLKQNVDKYVSAEIPDPLLDPVCYATVKEFMIHGPCEIDDLLRSIGNSLKKYDQLPQPPNSYLNNGANNLIIEETSYGISTMDSEHRKLLCDCTEEQRKVYDAVLESVESGSGGLFFVYGSGGCGKTFLWRTLICKLRSLGKIVLPVASSGIAATLMSGGQTGHSRFKIPIVLDEFSTCNISHNSDIAQLIKQTNLIIWDEAPMQHRYAFECLDRSLKDIMKAIDPACYKMPFGGITVVLGGDFRQILPVITYGDRADIVAACITRSKL